MKSFEYDIDCFYYLCLLKLRLWNGNKLFHISTFIALLFCQIYLQTAFGSFYLLKNIEKQKGFKPI